MGDPEESVSAGFSGAMIFAMDLAIMSMDVANVISAILPSRAASKARAAALKKSFDWLILFL